MTLLSTAVSRTRSPIAAQMRPRPVHEKAATTMTRPIAAQADGAMSIRRIRAETMSEKAATSIALQITGQRTAQEERQPARGTDEDVRQGLLVALAGDGVGHREQTGDRGVLHRIPDHVELVGLHAGAAPDVDEEQNLEDRRDHEGRDEDPGREPVDQPPVGGQAADEEDPERRRHVSDRLAFAPCGPKHALGEQHAEQHVGDAEQHAHPDVGHRRPAGRGLPDRAHPPGWREQPRDRRDPAGQQRQGHEESADQPHRVLGHRSEGPGVAVPRERDSEQEPERSDGQKGRRDGQSQREWIPDREIDPEHDPSPEDRRGHAVDADGRRREADRQDHEREVRGRRDEELERPDHRSRCSAVPAAMLVAVQIPITAAPRPA